ncbi:MAG: hypothetical protein ACI9Y8_001983 [Candidatus Omnitrophota bacterium]|jgi:hypothetical protein
MRIQILNKFGLIFISLALLQTGLLASSSFAAPPLGTDDIGTNKANGWETEFTAGYSEGEGAADDTIAIEGLLKYGITDALRIDVGLPYEFRQRKAQSDVDAVGDIKLHLKYRLNNETESLPGLALRGDVNFKTDSRISQGGEDFHVFGILEKTFEPIIVDINLGYRNVDQAINGNTDIFTYAGSIRWVLNDAFRLVGELTGNDSGGMGADNPLEILAGIQHTCAPGQVGSIGVGIGLTDSSPDWRIVIGLHNVF